LHDVTSRAGFHILLQSDATPLDASPLGPYVHVIRIHSWPGSGAVIVRPDGYLGMRAATADRETVTRWLSPMVPAKNLAS
jgi:hypothetical protein